MFRLAHLHILSYPLAWAPVSNISDEILACYSVLINVVQVFIWAGRIRSTTIQQNIIRSRVDAWSTRRTTWDAVRRHGVTPSNCFWLSTTYCRVSRRGTGCRCNLITCGSSWGFIHSNSTYCRQSNHLQPLIHQLPRTSPSTLWVPWRLSSMRWVWDIWNHLAQFVGFWIGEKLTGCTFSNLRYISRNYTTYSYLIAFSVAIKRVAYLSCDIKQTTRVILAWSFEVCNQPQPNTYLTLTSRERPNLDQRWLDSYM